MSNPLTEASSLHLSELAPGSAQSEIRAMTVACAAVNGINMAQGVCDTDPPHPVVEEAIAAIRAGHNIYTRADGIAPLREAIAAIRAGHNIYTRADGIAPLREAIAAKFAKFNGIEADPNTEVLVASGATGALNASLMALLNPGDECIVIEPFYGYHLATLRAQRVKPVVVPTHAPDWALDFDRLDAAVTSRTRAIILNSPSNPSGKVFTQAEVEELAEFATQHDLFVFTDEMYEYFIYDGERHRSIAALPGMAERTITISGFSKTFSVTGWRLGYLAVDAKWMPSISYFHDLTYVCAPAPLQHAAAAGLLALPDSFYKGLSVEYQAKRDMMCAALTKAGLTPSIPTGAYYVLADVSSVQGADARAKSHRLLADIGVAAVAGSAFFANDANGDNRGANLLRFCFAKKDEELAEACRRIESLAK